MTTQPESRVQRAVQQAVKDRGGFVFKVHGNEHMMAGLPDLVVCYRGLFVSFECKMVGNDPTPIQIHRRDQINNAGGFWAVVYGEKGNPSRATKDVNKVLDFIDREARKGMWVEEWRAINTGGAKIV